MMHEKAAGSERVSYEQVWALWNEGNLFSLSVAQMRGFLQSVGVPTDSSQRKAAVVRKVEEFLHSKDAGTALLGGQQQQQQQQQRDGSSSGYGKFGMQQSALPPETLLDLAQAGFYEGVANMAPKAFQLLSGGASPDAVIARLNTASFPGFPSNTECYSFIASDADVAIKARFSKVLQWCFMNMSNMQMDGELEVSLGKLLVDAPVAKLGSRNTKALATHGDEFIVSAYALQQRMQLDHPYTWVSTVPESAIEVAESFLAEEGFALLSKSPRLHYDATIKRAQDTLFAELDEQAKLVTLHNTWVNVQTVYHTRDEGPDVRLLLRSRSPVRQSDVEQYTKLPVITLLKDDVQDVLPPEHGQLVYLSESETRRFERINDRGIVVTVTETKRQPLIVLRDDEEDPRVEYSVSVVIPASVGGARAMDVRAVGLEVFELANRFAVALEPPFVEAYGN